MFKGYIENLFNAKKGDIGFVQISHVQNWLPGFLRFLVNIHNLNHYKQFSWRYLSWKLIQAIDVKSTRNWDFLHGPQIAFSQTGWHVPACKPLDMVKLHSILFRAFGNNFSVSCIVLPLNCVWIFGSTKSILLPSCVGSHGYQRIPFGYTDCTCVH